MELKRLLTLGVVCALALSCAKKSHVYRISDFETATDFDYSNTSVVVAKVLRTIKQEVKDGESVVLKFDAKRYDFYPEGAERRVCYISNHDQVNPKTIGINVDGIDNLTIDGGGADFVFHGRMLPVVVSGSDNCTLRDFAIDFENPHIAQAKVLVNDTLKGEITYELAPWVKYRIEDEDLIVYGDGWSHSPETGIAFEQLTRRLVYQTSDIWLGTKSVQEVSSRVFKAKWDNSRIVEGTVIAMRGWGRPTPGIFLEQNKNTVLSSVTVHYAEGMGLLAQLCENVTLNDFNVALRGGDDPRYFTTQADATHFSGCKGAIVSVGGLYENMMDDAINVHGTYLKIIRRLSDNRVVGRYMHNQSWGFDWGYEGDEVQFVAADVMELIGSRTKIKSIKPLTEDGNIAGVQEFEIEFTDDIDSQIDEQGVYGIENLEWTPRVLFADNMIRNNRARGTLFSTPKEVVVENNTFDHTSGTAILLCGDCNGWFETGACRDVTIRGNRFIGSLTSMFQFTNAIISIYPEIPQLDKQHKYFHGGEGEVGVVIEDNYFETFDVPIVYAKSLDGLIFRNNKIVQRGDYAPYHWNKHRFLFDRVVNYTIENNEFEGGFDMATDVKVSR